MENPEEGTIVFSCDKYGLLKQEIRYLDISIQIHHILLFV
jgi:hypothetical protein